MLFHAKRTPARQGLTIVVLLAISALIAALRQTKPTLYAGGDALITALCGWFAVGGADAVTAALHLALFGRAFAEELLATLEQVFGGLRWGGAVGAGLVAASETLLFQGIVQPWLGLGAAVGLFTLAHMGPRRLLPLAPWTALEGLWLALLYRLTGNALVPMTVHALHDTVAILALPAIRRRIPVSP